MLNVKGHDSINIKFVPFCFVSGQNRNFIYIYTVHCAMCMCIDYTVHAQ